MSDPLVALARIPSSSDVGGPKSQRQPKDSSDVIARDWEERAKALETVRKKLRSGWRNDEQVLEQYFQSCVETWKKYTGVRPPKKVLKLQGVYKQAMLGDIIDPPPFELKSVEGLKWSAWNNCKGMDKLTAKRRFITLLSEIDPLLIDVMPDEKVVTTSSNVCSITSLSVHSHSHLSSSLTHILNRPLTYPHINLAHSLTTLLRHPVIYLHLYLTPSFASFLSHPHLLTHMSTNELIILSRLTASPWTALVPPYVRSATAKLAVLDPSWTIDIGTLTVPPHHL